MPKNPSPDLRPIRLPEPVQPKLTKAERKKKEAAERRDWKRSMVTENRGARA